MKYDVFISYASEDESFVSLLAELLTKVGVKLWFAPDILKVGDSLSRSIDKGLANAEHGVVVLSKPYIAKSWTEYELRGLTSKAIGNNSVILPVWHDITRDDILAFSPPLVDAVALPTSKMSLHQIALKIIEVVRPDIYKNLLRLKALRELEKKAERKVVPIKDLKLGPIRHKTLPENLLVRLKIINHVLSDVFPTSLEHRINLFRRDVNPIDEITQWEKISAAYLDATKGKDLSKEQKKDIAKVLLGLSVGTLNDETAQEFDYLSYEEVVDIVNLAQKVVPEIVDPDEEPEAKLMRKHT